jgi:hypothetical protein
MKRIFLMMAAVAASMTACITDDAITPSANRIAVSPSIETLTRATETNFEDGDRIGLTIIKADNSFHAENAPLTHDGDVFTGDAVWYTETGEESYLVAYYPYDEAGAPATFTISPDQRGDGYAKSDLMGAGLPGVKPSASAVGMTFKHLLTKINVNLTNRSGVDVTSVALQGVIPTADIDLKALTVEVDDAASPTAVTAQEVTKNTLYRAIVVPQEVALTLAVKTSDGKTLSQAFTTATLRQGGQYKVDVTVAADGLKAKLSGEIFAWTDEGTIPAAVAEIPDDRATPAVAAGGFFVANEDWMGHDNGSVNYFKKEGNGYTPLYRVYRAANEGEKLGITTQWAAIWGNNVYFSSKQGDVFVVADAKTMKMKAKFTTLNGEKNNSGRTFTGIDDTKGYIPHDSGIAVFDIAKTEIAGQIDGVSGNVGAMSVAGERVFAVVQDSDLHIINTATDKLETTLPGTYYNVTRSKDGDIWAASDDGFTVIDPETLETESVPYPSGVSVGGAWSHAGSLCASTQTNTLYWVSGAAMFGAGGGVVKYDIDTRTARTGIYGLGKSHYGTQLELYSAGMRVDPLTDELILMVKHSGFGANAAYNWMYILDADGNEKSSFEYFGDNGPASEWASGRNMSDWNGKYFWFPAVPFFEDANPPQIVLNQVLVKAGETKTIDLAEKIVDYDNTFASIRKSVALTGDNLAAVSVSDGVLTVTAGTQTGSTNCTLTAISNGVRVEKTVRIDIQ